MNLHKMLEKRVACSGCRQLKDIHTDVVELCALLQCLGFTVKSLETRDENTSQECGVRCVSVSCQGSGFHVRLECPDVRCSCPTDVNKNNSGFWQVSGMTGGKQHNTESGSGLLGSLPRVQRDRITKELQAIIKCIKEFNESDGKPKEGNRSTSMLELNTPEKGLLHLKIDTPTRYRSLDILTTNEDASQPVGPPLKQLNMEKKAAILTKVRMGFERQSTYTISSTPGSVRCRNKTSSPIQTQASMSVMENLIAAEKGAEELRIILASVIQELGEDAKNDSSYLALDVSKISLLKGAETSKAQFSSSPNLQSLGSVSDDVTSRLKRSESSASASTLAAKDNKQSRLRRMSPSLFKLRSENPTPKLEKKPQESKISKFNSLFKPKATAADTNKSNTENRSANSSATKKRFSHVKSTIPRSSLSRKD
ncbi:unnamed protein product [Leptosia nina]|uniref:Uncharacterized protein n=1 Tax=Leptosia nina TaxID=320188 RepID=A0AAV1JZK4_9NEOP